MRRKKDKSAAIKTFMSCGKKCKHTAASGCIKGKAFELVNNQPLGVIRPVEPGNIQVGLPNGKEPDDTNRA